MELRSLKKNKKGSTFEGWTEGMVFSVLIVILVGVLIFPSMNAIHSGNKTVEGLPTGDIEQKFQSYQTSQSEKVAGGDASFTSAVGLTLSTSWDILIGALTMVMSFITGGWVETLVSYLHLPSQVGFFLRGLWIVSLGFIILRILFNKRDV